MTSNAKNSIALKWIKAESGETYLCNLSALEQIENPTEDDLRHLCMRESDNPQND